MARIIMLFIASGLILVGCSPDKTNDNSVKITDVVSGDSKVNNAINNEIIPSNVLQDSPEYLAENEDGLIMLFIASGLILVGCSPDKTNDNSVKITDVVSG
ncbi:hypothetical protein ACQKNX_12765, partial [Lysinibacillus sp. NPDC093712]